MPSGDEAVVCDDGLLEFWLVLRGLAPGRAGAQRPADGRLTGLAEAQGLLDKQTQHGQRWIDPRSVSAAMRGYESGQGLTRQQTGQLIMDGRAAKPYAIQAGASFCYAS